MATNNRTEKDSPFDRFNQQDGDQSEPLAMLAKVLSESPQLNAWTTKAINNGRLSNLGLLDADDAALGHYDGTKRVIRLESDLLSKGTDSERALNRLTDVLGHEITHALRGEAAFRYREEFSSRVNAIAMGQEGPRDYTPLIREFVEWRRQEEAVAELGGISAVASRLRHTSHRAVTENALAGAVGPTSSCVVRNDQGNAIGFKPGIQFDPKTQTVPVNAGNQEAVAQCFLDVDRPSKDYTTGAVADAMSYMARIENDLAH